MSHQEHETGPPQRPNSAKGSIRDNDTANWIRRWARSRANWPGADREGFASEVIYRILAYEHKGHKIQNLNALTNVIIQKAADEERKKAARHARTVDVEALENITGYHSDCHGADSFTISELLTDLDVAFEHMEESKREVVRYRLMDELNQEETAKILGIPPGTVKSRQHRGLRDLRNDPVLRGYDTANPDPDC